MKNRRIQQAERKCAIDSSPNSSNENAEGFSLLRTLRTFEGFSRDALWCFLLQLLLRSQVRIDVTLESKHLQADAGDGDSG